MNKSNRDGLATSRKKPGSTFAQFIAYGFVGGAAASIDIACLGLFVYWLDIDYRLANFFSFTVGTFTNFLLCNYFIFEKRALSFRRACGRHYFSSLGGLLVNQTALILLVELVFGEEWLLLSKLIASGCSFVFNFTAIRLYAFDGSFSLRRTVKQLWLP